MASGIKQTVRKTCGANVRLISEMIKNVANDVVPMICIFPLLIFHRGAEYGYNGPPQNNAQEKNLPYDKRDSFSGSAASLPAGHLGSGVNGIKLFSSVLDTQDKQARVFLTFSYLSPKSNTCRKAGAYLSWAPKVPLRASNAPLRQLMLL